MKITQTFDIKLEDYAGYRLGSELAEMSDAKLANTLAVLVGEIDDVALQAAINRMDDEAAEKLQKAAKLYKNYYSEET